MREICRKKTIRRTEGRTLELSAALLCEMPAVPVEAPQACNPPQSYFEKIVPQPFTRLVSTPAIFRPFHTVVDTVS